ncbi:MAG: extracellular solute-binding protein [Candidatus Ornithospirochaeta sp.]
MKMRTAAVIMALLLLAGCTRTTVTGITTTAESTLPKGAYENEILTMSPVAQDKEMVTIHFEYGFTNAGKVAEAIEQHFPNVDVVMVHDGATDSTSLLEGNLRNGTECDIIFSRVIQNLKNPEDYLYDLSGEDFTGNYYLTSLETCILPDGSLYYLPGPANIYGIIYDKTALEENGWSVPTTYSEFVSLVKTIDSSGLTVTETLDGETKEVPVRAIRPSMKFNDSFRIQLYPFMYQELFAGKENVEWLVSFQNGDASMVGKMERFAEKLQSLVDDGIYRISDWDYMPRYRIPMLCTSHSAVMIYGPLNVFANDTLKNSDHEYAMMPIPTGDEYGSDYLYSIATFFIGVSKKSVEESIERKKLLMEIMAFISSPEAQNELYGDTNLLVSNIKNVTPVETEYNSGIMKTIREGRLITDFTTTSEAKMNAEAKDMLSGKISVADWLEHADLYRNDYLKGITMYDGNDLGKCEDTLTRLETALLMGDVYRSATGADIALVYVDKGEQGANCRLFQGTLDSKAVENMAPDRTSANGEGIAFGTLTGEEIMNCINGPEDAEEDAAIFYVASGLNVEFAPWLPSGSRLISVTLPDGRPLGKDEKYKVAYMSDKLDNNGVHITPEDEVVLDGKWADHFSSWLTSNGGIVKRPEMTTILDWKTE